MRDKNTMEKWAEMYLENDITYKNHVSKFINYIKVCNKADTPTNISIDDVIDSIRYYNKLGKINSVSSMEIHLESIKAFYKFLISKHYVLDIFGAIPDYQEFKLKIVKHLGLAEIKERESFEDDTIKEILEKLDTYFENTSLENLSGTNAIKRYYNNLALRAFIKITLIAPAKKSVICSIRRCDFSEDYRSILINGVKIVIPNGLCRDLKHTERIISQWKNRAFEEKDFLFKFIDEDNFQNSDLNTWFCNLLKDFGFDIPEEKNSYSVEAIMNTAVINMVRIGANPAFISKINGTSIANLEKKYYKNELDRIEHIDSLINLEISKSRYYSYI